MGVVYLGRDPVIGRLVALKTIRVAAEDDLEQREFNERFLREAQAAGTLSHPHIVTIHDVGEEDETSFIAMEYVEGKNLKQVLREKERLSFDRVAEIIAQVADALDYAHRKGIVHRDVKPANIIITPDGTVKITDFGIAKIETSSLTETGQFLGTPNYMSPEQVTGETVDGRSDLFSLGVVLYELLTRKKPFLGDNVTSISYKIVHEDFPGLDKVDPAIPADFAPILARALAKDPAARYQRGSELSRALSEVRARQAEYQMIRDLGEMVAQAEKLGPVAPVEAPAAPPAAVTGRFTVSETTGRPGAAAEPKDSLEALARRRDDLNPQLVNLAATPRVDSSGPDWSLDTDALKKSARSHPAPPQPGPREPAPSSPGTLISDHPRLPRKGAGETTGAAEPSSGGKAATDSLPVTPVPRPSEKAAPRQVEAPPPARETPSLDTSNLVRGGDAGAPARRPPPVSPPSLPNGVGPGPRPPALPPEATGPIRRPGGPMPAPPHPPKEQTGGLRLDAPTGAPKERTAPFKLETPPPATKERTAPIRVEPPTPGAKERTAPRKLEPVALAPSGDETQDGVLRREVDRRWAWTIVGVSLAPALFVVTLLFVRGRQIVAGGELEGAAVRAAVAERRRLLDEGNRLLAEGKFEEAKQDFLELARRAPESAAAKRALQNAERQLARKVERDRASAQVAAHLSAARTAREGGDLAAVLAEADAALTVEPDHSEALALRREAADMVRRLPKAEQRKVEARVRSLRATAPAAAPPASAADAVPAPGTAGPFLRVAFRSPFDAGTVFLRMGGTQVLRRSFDFERRKGGLVEANLELPAGSGELRAWVFSADGAVRSYGVLRIDLPDGARRAVLLGLDGGQRLTMALE